MSARYYPSAGRGAAVIWVGGVGGGFDSPARDLYPDLAEALTHEGVASLRVRYRNPVDLEGCTADVLAGLAFLEHEGVTRVGLVGHSFGGAVVARAGAARSDLVRAVILLATQAYGAEPVRDVAADCGVLLIHGTADRILPDAASRRVHAWAHAPKRLILHEGAGHVLDEVAEAVGHAVHDWLREHLAA